MSVPIGNEEADASGALETLRSILIEGETLEAWAIERRIFALTHRRVLIAATSGRFIALRRGLFGGFEMQDLRWQDLKDVNLRVGILGADITLMGSAMADLAGSRSVESRLSFSGLRKEQTQRVYRVAQNQEQAWREKRRIRELEEMRAQSGGVQISSAAAPPGLSAGSSQPGDAVSRLQQAKQMLDAKLITDSEYETIKARIISGV